MDFEALFLGIEPIVALTLGAAAIAIGTGVSLVGNTEVGKTITHSGRDLTKNGIKWGIDAVDKLQGTVAEAGESWNDLVAEAQSELKASRNSSVAPEPKEVTIAE
jgi:hypothetical protein